MSVLYQSQPIETTSVDVATIAAAWEMTKFTLAARQSVTADQVREEFKKNYKTIYEATDKPHLIET